MITMQDIIFEDFSIKVNPELEELNEESIGSFLKDYYKLGKDIITHKTKTELPDFKDKFTEEQIKAMNPQIKKIYNYASSIIKNISKRGDYYKYIDIYQYNIDDKYTKETFKAVGDIIIYEGDVNKYYNLYKKRCDDIEDAKTLIIKDFGNFGKIVKNKLKLPEGVTFKEYADWTGADEYFAVLHFTEDFFK